VSMMYCCVWKDDECEEGEIKETGDESPLSDGRPHIERPLSPPSVCRFYLRGTCTWGGNCRFHHPGTSSHIITDVITFLLLFASSVKLAAHNRCMLCQDHLQTISLIIGL